MLEKFEIMVQRDGVFHRAVYRGIEEGMGENKQSSIPQ